MLIKTTEYNSKLIGIFIRWYFIEMPSKMFVYTKEYLSVISYLFSFKFLLKTLFYPWKNQVYAYPSKGFDLQIITQVFISNLFARVIGAMIRMITIFIGIFVEIILVSLSFIIIFVWFFAPIVFFGSFIYSFFI